MKKYLIFIITFLLLFTISCNDYKYVPKKPDEIENFQKVDGKHEKQCDDVSPYILIKNKLVKNKLMYSMTLYMNFERGTQETGIKMSRFYKYYQVDYYLENNEFLCDYHVFDEIDGALRVYGQNFMPYYELESNLDKIMLQVKYSYALYNESTKENDTYNKELNISETIIKYDNTKEYNDNKYDIRIKNVSEEEKNEYKVSFTIDKSLYGHIDMQIYVMLDDGNIYPYFGVYHYEYKNGNYLSVSSEKTNNKIVKAFAIVSEENLDSSNTYYLNVNVE